MFESINELIDSDKAGSRRRFAFSSIASLIGHVLLISYITIASILYPPHFGRHRRAAPPDGNLTVVAMIGPLPPTPRVINQSGGRPAGAPRIRLHNWRNGFPPGLLSASRVETSGRIPGANHS